MKKLITLFTLLFAFSASIFSQTPQSLSYQAVARDAEGVCLSNETISLQISILDESPNGPVLYIERFEGNVQTNDAGHFQIEIGTGNPQIGGQVQVFSDVPWNNRTPFLKVEYAPGATTAFEEVGTTQLLSVPYAMAAGNGKQFSDVNQDEWMEFNGANGLRNVVIGGRVDENGEYNNGAFSLRDDEGNTKVYTAVSDNKDGFIVMYGTNGEINASLGGRQDGDGIYNKGILTLRDPAGVNKVYSGVDGNNKGFLSLYGDNGLLNILMSGPGAANPNVGSMTFRDENGDSQAGIGLTTSGVATITATLKNFRIQHPNDPTKSIWYACIEGPEAAAYDRGTATLVNGEAFIPFPEYFGAIINPTTMTVNLTPNSADTYGLAVIEKTAAGIRVKELKNGTGNFSFDWEVKAVRKGHESFQVVRDRATDMDIFGTIEEDRN